MISNFSKAITILGSTGSIGCQTLDVIASLGDDFRVHSLAAFDEVDKIAEQARIFSPDYLVLFDIDAANKLADIVDIPVLNGLAGLKTIIQDPDVDIVVNAISGAAGLLPASYAIEAGKRLASANKESFVIAGHIFREAMSEGADIVPIDSEHSAIFQAILSGRHVEIKKLILTASGGPFFSTDRSLETVTPEEALKHPNWSMGPRITIDSATMFNKALEVIEARWLFDIAPEMIDVIVHPQSIVHSIVEFVDNSQIAQLSMPDMRLPIQYALTYPNRRESPTKPLDLGAIGKLTFHSVPKQRFPALDFAYTALKMGGVAPAIINAADEIAVQRFLENKIKFTQIPKIIEQALSKFHYPSTEPEIEEILNVDSEVRKWARCD